MKNRRQLEKTPLQRAIAACRGSFFAVAMFSCAVNVLMLASPLYMMQVFDRVLPSGSTETLLLITLVTAGAFVVLAMLDSVRGKILIRISSYLDAAISNEALRLSIAGALTGGGHSVQALRDVTQVRQFLTGPGVLSLFDAPWSLIFLFVIFLFHVVLGLVATGGAVLLFALAVLNEFVTRGPIGEANTRSMIALKRAEAGVRNADVAEAMGMTDGLLRRWARDNNAVIGLQTIASERASYIVSSVKFLRLSLQTSVYAVGAYLAIRQQITPGIMFAAALLMARALSPVESAIATWRNLLAARAAYRRLNDVMSRAPARDVAMALPPPQGNLSVERAVYVPPGAESAVLKGVSFELGAGQILGIIGPTAAGKSTLARLIVGSWRATSGTVRLDDADVYSWERTDFGRHVGYLPQDVELFAGTVKENIARFGDADADQIVAAAQLAGIHEMILHLSDGYETEIGEGGEVLSGGQRQRIALARALLGPPRLLVLDEPNANLDAEGERALLATLVELRTLGITTIIIAHRMNVLEQVDKMVLLRGGMIEEFGSRSDVLDKIREPRVAEAGRGRVASNVRKLEPGGSVQGQS
ncbi:MAG: type I secretion system permease/ATPase [Dongiaceae bacterium]